MIPHNPDAERAVLGAALLRVEAADRLLAQLDADDFFQPAHQTIFDAIAALRGRGEQVDPITVCAEIGPRIEAIGGKSLLTDLLGSTPSTDVERYTPILRRLRGHRAAAAAAHEVLAAIGQDDDDALERARLTFTTEPPAHGVMFEPIDLAAIINRGPQQPELLTPFLYAGRFTTLSAEPGGAKTWVALWQTIEVLRGGRSVVYIDLENGDEIIAERLALLGANPDELYGLCYLRPHGCSWSQIEVLNLLGVLDGLDSPALVVFDSLPDFLAGAGLNEDAAGDITGFVDRVLAPILDRGAAVLVLDHLPKPAADGSKKRSRYARGSGAKLAKVDVNLLLETEAEFSATASGRLALRQTKDRLGRLGLPGVASAGMGITVDVSENGVRFATAPKEASEWHGPTECMAAIIELLEAQPDEEWSGRKVRESLSYKDRTVMDALKHLVADGTLIERKGPRNAVFHSLNPLRFPPVPTGSGHRSRGVPRRVVPTGSPTPPKGGGTGTTHGTTGGDVPASAAFQRTGNHSGVPK